MNVYLHEFEQYIRSDCYIVRKMFRFYWNYFE